MGQLDKVSIREFKEIVREIKPKIGFFGGRYFKTLKKTYTMNQITKKYFDLIDSGVVNRFGQEGVEISTLIVGKNKQANILLKKGSCFQKKMTKLKRKLGNRIFKSKNSKFIGKASAFELMTAVSRAPSNSQTSPIETLIQY